MKKRVTVPEMTNEDLDILYQRIEKNHARPEEYEILDQFVSAIGHEGHLQKKMKKFGIYDYKELIERRKLGYESETNRMTGAAQGVVRSFKRYNNRRLHAKCSFACMKIQPVKPVPLI
ncbi:hypothetical protein [Terrimonas ferruginea]|uniref:hypothetical protein n=1 Tax=Terrimonas ferruginea TaxID=249 RepID=UPI00042891F9|nr:hypothetical protein [Terrimonas ferruginea]